MHVLISVRDVRLCTNFTPCSQARDKGRFALTPAALLASLAAGIGSVTPGSNRCESCHGHRDSRAAHPKI